MLGALHVAFVQALIGSDLPGLQCLAWASIVRADDDRTGERAHCQFASQVGTDECDVQLDNRTTVTFSLCSETPNHFTWLMLRAVRGRCADERGTDWYRYLWTKIRTYLRSVVRMSRH
ncbi:hypothetical protein BDP67DRAFT_491089 [Colletotrichum lupini]|nr:hypothetical protein BDP67DRAFT_491089 [Colletotrichum lupini]